MRYISVKELEEIKDHMLETGRGLLHKEEKTVVEFEKSAAVKLFLLAAALASTAIKYTSEAESMRDAAEFEARVAQFIAMPCRTMPPNIHGKSSAWIKLRLARIAVEQEMELTPQRKMR